VRELGLAALNSHRRREVPHLGAAAAAPWRPRPLAEGRAQMGPERARGWASGGRREVGSGLRARPS
jgi:hypothetical protein